MSSDVLLNPISPLRHVAFGALLPRISGGSSAPTSQTITQTNLPEYADPYFERLLQRAESVYGKDVPYEGYTGQRQASLPQDITSAYDVTRQIAGRGIAGLPEATAVATGNIQAAQDAARRAGQPAQFSQATFSEFQPTGFGGFQAASATPFSGFQAGQFQSGRGREFAGFQAGRADPFAGFAESQFQAGRAQPFAGFQEQQVTPFAAFQEAQAQQFQFAPTEKFSGAAVQQYMSPYMQAVVDQQQREARQEFGEQSAERAARAVAAGAFGGSRQAVQEGIAQRGLLDRLAGIQATGTQQAFEQAAQQFGADRAAEFARQQAQAGELGRTQGVGVSEAARVQAARAAELARTQGISVEEARRVQESRAAEQARVQGIDIGEQARVQEAAAQERARVQAARAAEMARVQGITIDEASRIQAAQAAEAARVQGIDIGEDARVQQAQAAENARVQEAQARELARVQGVDIEEARRIQGARAAEAARVQSIQAGEAGRVQAAGAGEMARVQGAQAAENRAALQTQLQALGFGAEQAQQLVGFGEAGRAADIQGAQLLENIGLSQLAREQEARDIAYQDFIAQRAFPEQQLQGISSILRGVPVQPGTTTTAYAPYNPLQQALGAGLGAIGLYRGLTG